MSICALLALLLFLSNDVFQSRPSTEYLSHHAAYLKRAIPPSRLHFFNVKDGWGTPLQDPQRAYPRYPVPAWKLQSCDPRIVIRTYQGSDAEVVDDIFLRLPEWGLYYNEVACPLSFVF
jgi:hypothetical protein